MKFSQLEIAECSARSAIYPKFFPLPVSASLSYARGWWLAGEVSTVFIPLRAVSGTVDEQAYEAADHFFRKGYLP
jgi:hypothetical protein